MQIMIDLSLILIWPMCLCSKFEVIWTNENRGMEKRSWRMFYYVVQENGLGAFSCPPSRVFSRPFTHGGICPPHIWGGQALMGGPMRGHTDLMGGGPNFDRLYHKLQVLLLLSYNYMTQFVGYDSIKPRSSVSYRFQIRTITQHQ